MAHFAQIDDNNIVTQVIVVDNSELLDSNNVEQEAIGITFCTNLFGADTRWKQTSYNGNIRKNYACIDYTYDVTRDAFIAPQPYASWALNETTCQWEAPVAYPTNGNLYTWNEDNQQWDQVNV
jgi:hypothetical protein